MPYDDPHPEDPNELVGVGLPADPGSWEEMGYTFAEEFAALGRSEAWILRMFRSRGFAAAHEVLRQLGEDRVRSIVKEAVDFRIRVRGGKQHV